jgi:hypothetical protein
VQRAEQREHEQQGTGHPPMLPTRRSLPVMGIAVASLSGEPVRVFIAPSVAPDESHRAMKGR